jgi:class 3 adenylate cyclase
MGLDSDLRSEVGTIFRSRWEERDGEKVPEPEDLKLGNDGVNLKGTVLYADLADSTDLVLKKCKHFAAEVYKAYLTCASRIIRANNGVITAFDGDRVMAVYIGGNKNTDAAKTALQINYAVREIINVKMKEFYTRETYEVRQSVGIDTSDLFVARTGIRKYNDLVWVGRAANFAAKLCGLREGGYASYITEDVYTFIGDSSKYSSNTPRRCMWEKVYWPERGINVYRSSWTWTLE